jgi:Cu+-exporting ATPase
MHMQHKIDPQNALKLPSFRALYVWTAVVGALVLGDLLFRLLGWTGLQRPFGYELALLAALVGGARIVYGALAALLEGDLGADLALAIAMLAALVLREYLVGAEVALIAMVGECLEAVTFQRAHRELRKILELNPRTARVRRDGGEIEVPIGDVHVGDTVIVRPGERIPVDGSVLAGRTAVDQSALTGESLPVDKAEADSVYAGTLNQFGAIELRADRVGEDTTLGQVIQLVAEAQENKAPLERAADRLARAFLPVVMAAAVATLVYTNWGATAWKSLNWMPTLAVLVVACPCALILATPAAVMAGVAWMARRGVLVKGGIAFERLAGVDAIAFDKTGTLTQGRLQLGDVLPRESHTSDELLQAAATAEQLSEHPIARLVVSEAKRRGLALSPLGEFTAHPGIGVVATIGLPAPATSTDPAAAAAAPTELAATLQPSAPCSTAIAVGNRRLLEQQAIALPADVEQALAHLDSTGQTPLVAAVNGVVLGAIGVRDTVRSEAADVVHDLWHLGIEDVALLTGDRRPAADTVARTVGIDRVAAELLPGEKADWLVAWRQSRTGARPDRRGSRVAMIGDGINDAPALAIADVGLALGGVGSDIAAEAGDFVLMGDPLRPLPDMLRFSRAVVRVIRQNIVFFAFGLNAAAILLSAEQVLGPIGAAITHQIGSFLVLCNAVRLLWFDRWESSGWGAAERALARWGSRVTDVFQPVASAFAALQRRRGLLASLVASAAIIGYGLMGVTCVAPDELAAVKRFGKFRGTFGPGLRFFLPPPFDVVVRIAPERIRVAEIGFRSKANAPRESAAAIEWDSQHRDDLFERMEDESLIFTGDNRLLELNASVHYSLRRLDERNRDATDSSVRRYLFEVRQPDELLRAVAESVLRELAAQSSFAAILTEGRRTIEEQARAELQRRADRYDLGIVVRAVTLQDVHPPLEVVSKFRELARANKERERELKMADAYRTQQIIAAAGSDALQVVAGANAVSDASWTKLAPLLAGEAKAAVLQAEADRDQRTNESAGDAARFESRRAAYRTASGVSELRLYFETIAAVLADKETLLLDPAAAGRRHLFFADPDKFSLAPRVLMPETPASAGPARPREEEQ